MDVIAFPESSTADWWVPCRVKSLHLALIAQISIILKIKIHHKIALKIYRERNELTHQCVREKEQAKPTDLLGIFIGNIP